MTAENLKIGDSFKRQGITFTVCTIESDSYKNGTKCLHVGCKSNGSDRIDSYFSFKLNTKVK